MTTATLITGTVSYPDSGMLHPWIFAVERTAGQSDIEHWADVRVCVADVPDGTTLVERAHNGSPIDTEDPETFADRYWFALLPDGRLMRAADFADVAREH
jgi:hypothetical protein